MTFARKLWSLALVISTIALLLLATGCGRGCGGGKRPRRGDATSERPGRGKLATPSFAKRQLDSHFQKHGAALGHATKADYQRGARALVAGGPGIETHQRGDDKLFFKESTGEFAVLSKRNVIRTYFRPSDGRRYWERQKEK